MAFLIPFINTQSNSFQHVEALQSKKYVLQENHISFLYHTISTPLGRYLWL